MKILYSLPHPADKLSDSGSGHTVRASALLAALEKRGHEVVRLEASEESGTSGVVGFYRNVVKKVLPRPIAMRLRDTARIAHGRRYAIALIEAVQGAKPNLILETHIAFSLASKLASDSTGVPYMLDDVAPSWEEANMYGVGLAKQALEIHRQVTKGAKLLVAVNQTMRGNLLKDGLPAEKIAVIENGIDDTSFHIGVNGTTRRREWNIPDDATVIVFVGSFQPYHRVDLLLQAAAKLPKIHKFHLLLVGEGQKTLEAKELAQNLNLLDRVTFTGSVPYQDVPSYVAAGDLTIMPATNEYGNPMKVYEYMALGLPIIAPNQDTITEIISHQLNGYLFERENVDAIAAALEMLINDPELRKRLGTQAAESANKHTWLKRAEKLEEAWARVGLT